jgi:mono/diheme cytochrome c family protein
METYMIRTLVGVAALVAAGAGLGIATGGPAAAGSVESSNPLSGDKDAIEAGQTAFRANCAYCHGMHADGRGRGLPNAADLRKFKRGYSHFVTTIKEGYRTMPAWGGMGELTDEQINQIGAYLETLARPGANWMDKEEESEAETPGAARLVLAAAEAQAAEPKAYQSHLDQILKSSEDTPGKVGLVTILEQETDIAAQHAGFAVKDLEDLANIQLHTHHVRHAVDPSTEPEGGPGKGYGIIKAAKGVIQQMELARDSADATDSVKTHSVHVITAANNVVHWAGKILDKAGQITGGASPVASSFFAEQNVELLDWIKNGHDADGDGTITWQESEGGLAQIKQHLSYIE